MLKGDALRLSPNFMAHIWFAFFITMALDKKMTRKGERCILLTYRNMQETLEPNIYPDPSHSSSHLTQRLNHQSPVPTQIPTQLESRSIKTDFISAPNLTAWKPLHEFVFSRNPSLSQRMLPTEDHDNE